MKKRLYIEIPGVCIRQCKKCPSTHSHKLVDTAVYHDLLDDAKNEGFNWVGFCGVNPIAQAFFPDVLTYSLACGMATRVYGDIDIRNLDNVPAFLLRNLQYTVILTEEMLAGKRHELLDSLASLKKQYDTVTFAVKIATPSIDGEMVDAIRSIGFFVYHTGWWFMFRGDSYGVAVNIPAQTDINQTTTMRDPDSFVCKASRDKVFIDQNLNLRACYMAQKSVANLQTTKLSECMNNDLLWGAWRTIKLKDMIKCQTCTRINICHICPASLIETGKQTTCMLEKQN